MAKAKMDEHGRVQIPSAAIKKLGLKNGTEFELKQEDGVLVLKPIAQKPRTFKSPPLSAIELADIEEGEREFASGTAQVFDNVSDLLNDLHAERKKAQAAKKKPSRQ
jgi:bifunctional DNA-binding transcriptional regulator/antitoxin component of YhaV-PrlF toxin-antitoxin module